MHSVHHPCWRTQSAASFTMSWHHVGITCIISNAVLQGPYCSAINSTCWLTKFLQEHGWICQHCTSEIMEYRRRSVSCKAQQPLPKCCAVIYRKADSGFAPRGKTLGNARERYGSSPCPTNSVTSSVQDWRPRMSFILKGSQISALQLNGWFKFKTSI